MSSDHFILIYLYGIQMQRSSQVYFLKCKHNCKQYFMENSASTIQSKPYPCQAVAGLEVCLPRFWEAAFVIACGQRCICLWNSRLCPSVNSDLSRWDPATSLSKSGHFLAQAWPFPSSGSRPLSKLRHGVVVQLTASTALGVFSSFVVEGLASPKLSCSLPLFLFRSPSSKVERLSWIRSCCYCCRCKNGLGA